MWLQGFREGASEFLEHVEPDSAKGFAQRRSSGQFLCAAVLHVHMLKLYM